MLNPLLSTSDAGLKLGEEPLSMIINSSDISDENLALQFREQLLTWLEKYQILAIDSIWRFYKESRFSPALFSEILELIRMAKQKKLKAEKIALLKRSYSNKDLYL